MSDETPYRPRRALGPVDEEPSHDDAWSADDVPSDQSGPDTDDEVVADEQATTASDADPAADADPETDAGAADADSAPGEESTSVDDRSPWSRPQDDAPAATAASASETSTPAVASDHDDPDETDSDSDSDSSSGSGSGHPPADSMGTTDVSRGRKVGRIGAVAALLVVVLAIGYAAFALTNTGGAVVLPGQDPPVTSTAPTPTPTPPVSEDRLLTTEQAQFLAPKATWTVARTQTGRDAESPVATCLQRPGADDTPAESTFLRTLTSSGDRELAALHEASTYADRDQAVQVFGEIARQLGGCATEGSYLDSAATVDALGNQALAVNVSIVAGQQAKPEFHTVLVIRTGRVLNVVDAAAKDKFITPQILAETMIPVINVQCTDAVGLCAQEPTTTPVVPPIGGDHPGLPVVSDVPRLPKMTGRWAATDPVRDPKLPVGTSCERLGSPAAKPTATVARAYLVQDDAAIPQTYGWDLVLFTLKDAKQASSFVSDVGKSMDSCEDRQQTAEVGKSAAFTGTGTNGTKLAGLSWKVRQQTGANSDTDFVDFRVALVQAGNKVVYVFLPLEKGVDFSDQQWQHLALRAGERATQIT